MLVLIIITIVVNVYLFIIIPKGFFPSRIPAAYPEIFRPARTCPFRP